MCSSFSNPTTIAPSIFSFTASNSSGANSSVSDELFFKICSSGKNGQEAGGCQPPRKRKRVNGRPRNLWTSTRLRKLTRLYLMTNLDVVDIIKTLEAEDFAPW